ncbi:hypothetical protein HKD37_05G012480 [Glycine soja]|nr:hypothetical protein GmHk_05G012603 [Glycine max]
MVHKINLSFEVTVLKTQLFQCWLKKQKGSLAPEQIDAEGETVSWTSGLIFGKGEGIVGQETEFGTLRVKFLVSYRCFWSPFALIQGTLEAQGGEGSIFKKIPIEDCPTIRRGPVAWWRTVFGSVLPEDMHIADKISILPTKSDVWKNVNVTILKNLVPLMLRRIEKGHENFNSKADPA